MKKTLRDNKRGFIGLGIGVLAAVIFPQVVRIRFVWNLLSLILVWAIVGMGWNVIGGYCGQVSNGHSLFYGIGAYTVGPVSYTHLDVYKRQSVDSRMIPAFFKMVFQLRFMGAAPFSENGAVSRYAAVLSTDAVSYTHLDVYKRQLQQYAGTQKGSRHTG